MTETITQTELARGVVRVLEDLGETGVDPFALTNALLQAGWLPPGAERVEVGETYGHLPHITGAFHFLDAAADAMRDRATSRDTPEGERSMPRAVTTFNALYGSAIIERIQQGHGPLSATMGWQFQSLLKKARAVGGAYREDDHVDDVAYAALAAESASEEYNR